MTPVTLSHIWLDDRGMAWIDTTNIKVIEIAMEWRSTGASPEELEFQHQGTLSLAQILAALAYYHDHREEFDREIQRQADDHEKRRAQTLDSPGRQRLRSLGKLP